MKMQITYFHWSSHNAPSIVRSFRPLIDKLKRTENVQEFRVPYNGSLPWNMWRNIVFVHKHRNAHGINHITGDIHYCILGLIGCKSVLTIHDDAAMQTAKRGWWEKLIKWFFWIYLPIKLADRVLCISKETKRRIDRLVRNGKTQVLFNHTVDSEFKYIPKEFNSDCPLLLQIGASPRKNLETTLKVLEELKCKLRVVKKMTPTQHAMAQFLGIDYCNVYDISDKQIVEEYINADIVLFPSLFEGFGLPIIEGQATGRAVITTNEEPMVSVAGGTAVLLNNPTDVQEYRNALFRLINDDAFREQSISGGLENTKKYTVNNVAQNFLHLYSSILK